HTEDARKARLRQAYLCLSTSGLHPVPASSNRDLPLVIRYSREDLWRLCG
ncbi:hypothetical protein NDU88_007326, partial [Pleurodeles waltl]